MRYERLRPRFFPSFLVPALVVMASLLIGPSSGTASPELEGIACRSVHLAYPAPEGDLFYNEVTVRESHEGTYFCVCGFRHGYFGIQQLRRDKKLVIFSIWDPGNQNDPNVVDETQRVRLLYRGDDVRTGRFGNEGTGGQSFFDYDWQLGKTYRFCVRSKRNDAEQRIAYAAYFYVPEQEAWKHLITFDRPADGKQLGGYYAFVEDFRRNRVSATLTRTAEFGNGWVRQLDQQWYELQKARFTGDGNPVLNIDAGVRDSSRFFLSTGGKITNDGTPLWESMELPKHNEPPSDLPLQDNDTHK